MKKVGLIIGREWSFPPKFFEAVQSRNAGVMVEYVKLGGTRMDEPVPYAVLVDRISHEVPYYRSYLKHAVLQGATVVNNPFMWTADDKFFGASLAAKLGIAHPKTVVLPNKDYVPGLIRTESLRNLIYPLDWKGLIDEVGLPCILKDAHGSGWRGVHICHTTEELIRYYDGSGLLTMVAQEYIRWDHYLRCLCLGGESVRVMPYDPINRCYLSSEAGLPAALEQRIVAESLKLMRALGYDMNIIEWAIRDGIPHAIDFLNPAPDMDEHSLTPDSFEWVVSGMADLVIDRALHPRPQLTELRWAKLF